MGWEFTIISEDISTTGNVVYNKREVPLPSKTMSIPEECEWVTLDGLGDIEVGKTKKGWTNPAGRPIIEVKNVSIEERKENTNIL